LNAHEKMQLIAAEAWAHEKMQLIAAEAWAAHPLATLQRSNRLALELQHGRRPAVLLPSSAMVPHALALVPLSSAFCQHKLLAEVAHGRLGMVLGHPTHDQQEDNAIEVLASQAQRRKTHVSDPHALLHSLTQ
jgi:hypothetical protein